MNYRILILTNSLSGLHSFRRELVERLCAEGFEVYISANDDPISEFFISLGCTCIKSEINRHGINPVTDAKLLLHYCRLLRKIKPHAVLSYTIKPNLYGGIACRLNGVPQLANITGLGSAFETPGLLQAFIVRLYRFALKRAECVFLQNKDNQDFCNSRRMIPARQRLLPGSGVNLERFLPLPYPGDDKTAFIFIGRIMRQKGIAEYLEAAKYIHEKYPQTEFHVLGRFEEDYSNQIDDMSKKGIVIYHSPVTEISPYLENIHCTVHPSFYPEGMSNVLLESCASARAIITTDKSGCREVVDDGVNGYIVQQQSLEDLIEKIERFINLPYEQKRAMGVAGRAKVEQHFDRKVVVNAYLDEIHTILNNK